MAQISIESKIRPGYKPKEPLLNKTTHFMFKAWSFKFFVTALGKVIKNMFL